MGSPSDSAAKTTAKSSAVVRPLPVRRDDAALLSGIDAGEPWAKAALFDRYATRVETILRRLLGPEVEPELADFVQDVFVQVLGSIDQLRDADALPCWLQTVATRVACRAIRARRARRWLRFWEPSTLPEIQVDAVEPELAEACRRTYAVLDRLPVRERIPFVLRYVDGMELRRIAAVCEVSLATVKRRLARGQQRFQRLAAHDEVLRDWLEPEVQS